RRGRHTARLHWNWRNARYRVHGFAGSAAGGGEARLGRKADEGKCNDWHSETAIHELLLWLGDCKPNCNAGLWLRVMSRTSRNDNLRVGMHKSVMVVTAIRSVVSFLVGGVRDRHLRRPRWSPGLLWPTAPGTTAPPQNPSAQSPKSLPT